jgi:hypothetical protein
MADNWTRAYDAQIRGAADPWLTDEEKDEFVEGVKETDQYKAALKQHDEEVALAKEVTEARAEEQRGYEEDQAAEPVKPAEQTGYSEDVAAGMEPSTTTPVDDALEASGVEVEGDNSSSDASSDEFNVDGANKDELQAEADRRGVHVQGSGADGNVTKKDLQDALRA